MITSRSIVLFFGFLTASILLALCVYISKMPFLKHYQINTISPYTIQATHDFSFISKDDEKKLINRLRKLISLNQEALENDALMKKNIEKSLEKLKTFAVPITKIKEYDFIVKKGEKVTAEQLELIEHDKRFKAPQYVFIVVGCFIFFIANMMLYHVLLTKFIPKQAKKINRYLLVLVLASFLVALAAIINHLEEPSTIINFNFLLPFPLVTTLLSILVNSTFAFLAMAFMICFLNLFDNSLLGIIFFYMFSCKFIILMIHQKYKRQDMIKAGYFLALIMMFATGIIGLINGFDHYLWYVINMGITAINAVFSMMLAMALVPYFESFFKINTNQTLLELADLNHPLLKRMMVSAPGTYQHSIMVSNLAETAAESISANAILCRVGGYFHDIGKISRPLFFGENQKGDNPHSDLSPRMSKTIIAAHVKEGIALAETYKLPKIIKEFIQEHHGTSLVSFFYLQAQNQDLRSNPEEDFRYPGPKPHFKESGILMLADAVEASVRALQKPNLAKIQSVVDEIFMEKIKDGQLDLCPLTIKELASIKASFMKILEGVHHKRLDYQNEIQQLIKQNKKVDKKD